MEAKHTPGTAAAIQQARELADLQNHRDRIVWLSVDGPTWACGERVDAYTRSALLIQSRAAIAEAIQ